EVAAPAGSSARTASARARRSGPRGPRRQIRAFMATPSLEGHPTPRPAPGAVLPRARPRRCPLGVVLDRRAEADQVAVSPGVVDPADVGQELPLLNPGGGEDR